MKTKLVKPILIECKEKSMRGDLVIDPMGLGIHCVKTEPSNHNKRELILVSLDSQEVINIGDSVYLGKNKIEKVIDITNKHSNIVCETATYLKEDVNKVIATHLQIPDTYIQQFISEYNKGEIKNIEIEMEYINGWSKDLVEDFHQPLYLHIQPKLTNGLVNIIEKEVERGITFNKVKKVDSEIIGKPLENYINEKHNQDRCMGFIDGYNARKSEELTMYSAEEVKKLCEKSLYNNPDDFNFNFNNWFELNKKK